jgi:hypothetical protein
MRLPTAVTLDEFKKLYDFLNGFVAFDKSPSKNNSLHFPGSESDNFYGTTSDHKGTEHWCERDGFVPKELALDNTSFPLLNERSFLYSKKGFLPPYKLIPIKYSQFETLSVHYFYCEPRYDRSR